MNVYVLLRGGESKRDGEVYTKWVFAILVRTFSFRFPLFLSSDRFLFFFVSIKREKIRSFIPVKNTITLDTLKFERE